MNTQIQTIIHSNPTLFDLYFKGYEGGKIIYSEPSQRAISEAEQDLKIFNEIQQAIYNRDSISDGDWVLLKNGEYSRVTVTAWQDSIQVGGTYGGSVHMGKSGKGSYSGSCGDLIDRANLEATTEYREAMAWIFSKGWAGAGRGVYSPLQFKVWREK